MTNLLSQAAIMLSKREVGTIVAATGLIFEQLKKDSQDKPLEKVLISQKGGTWGDESIEGVGYPVLRSSNMRGKKVDISDAAWCSIPAAQVDAFSLQNGDILVTKSSGSSDLVGKATIFFDPNDGNTYLFSNFTLRLRPDKTEVNPEYLAWFLRSPQSLMWRYEKQQNAVGLRNLQTKEYLSQIIPVPNLKTQEQVVEYLNLLELKDERANSTPLPLPLKKQRRIVTRIEALAARVTAAQSLRREANEEADKLSGSATHKLFAELAETYKPIHIGKTFTYRNDLIRPIDGKTGEIRFIGLQHIESNTGMRIGEDKLYGETLTGRKFVFSPGDIVYGYLRPYLNKVWIADCDGVCSVDQYVIQPKNSIIDTHYLAYFMKSPAFLDKAIELTHNLLLPRLRSGLLNSIPIPLPPLSEQRRLVVYLDGLQAQVTSLRTVQAESERELAALMPSILDKAFKGEI